MLILIIAGMLLLVCPCFRNVPSGLSCDLVVVVDTPIIHSHQLPTLARFRVLLRLHTCTK